MVAAVITHNVIILMLIIQVALSANILYIATFGSPSHHMWNKELAVGLVENGHNLTMLTHHPSEDLPKNLTFITIEGLFAVLAEKFDMRGAADASVLTSIKVMYDFTELNCAYDMNSDGLQVLLNYPKDYKFDLIIIDSTLAQCMYAIFGRFNNVPVVAVNLLPPLLSKHFGYHIYPSYMPYLSSEFSNYMSLSERILNVIYMHSEYLYHRYISQPRQFRIAQKRFGENITPFEEAEKNIHLMLTNTDSNLDYPMAFPPNVIAVGGLHIKPAQELSENLKIIFSKSTHGVIFFSLGTNVRSDQLNPQIRSAFLSAFSKLPQTVLWKFEGDAIEELPDNVIIRKWWPQRDILGHPNTILFISQCGGFSSQEAVYYGVPVVGIPFLIDQYSIVKRMAQRKLGMSLYHWNLTKSNIYDTVTEVLNNPTYKENMKVVSKRYRDQPQTPLQRGIFWIEYILRNGGGDHLVVPSRYMAFYETENLDVFAVFIAVIIAICSCISFTVTGCLFLFRNRYFLK